jgi:multiple sugar transport system ATP-binding protein
MATVTFDKATRIYPGSTKPAVDAIDLQVADGEFLVLVGPSGCGKSTTLRMLAGLEEVNDGNIFIGERNVTDVPPKDRDIAMVFQNYALYPHMTVARNMGFALKRAKVPAAEIQRKVQEAAELLGITDQLDRKPANLSGGQRQRVAMGRAIVRDPQAYLMDEPLSNLDAKLRLQMRSEIVRIQRRLSTTTVYVTHDQTEAMTLGDRVAVMRDGLLQQVGTPQELYGRPRNLFVAGFIGAPPMNFMLGRVSDGMLGFALGEIPIAQLGPEAADAARDAGRVVVGVRPEDFEDAAVAGERGRGVHVRATIDVLESTGSDIYAHLSIDGTSGEDEVPQALLDGIAAAEGEDGPPPGVGGPEVVARIDASSDFREGADGDLWLDSTRLHLFDTQTGERLAA